MDIFRKNDLKNGKRMNIKLKNNQLEFESQSLNVRRFKSDILNVFPMKRSTLDFDQSVHWREIRFYTREKCQNSELIPSVRM